VAKLSVLSCNGTSFRGVLLLTVQKAGNASGEQSTHPGDNLDPGDAFGGGRVENRSEPQEWLADGSPGSADPAQDADQSAGVKTALSTTDTQAADVNADAGADEAEQAAPHANGSSAYTNGSSSNGGVPNGSGSSPWDNGGSSYESSSAFESSSPFEASSPFESSSPYEAGSAYESTSSWDNAGSASPSGAAVPASWASSPVPEAAPAAPDADVAAGFAGSSPGSGSPTVAAPYAAAPYAAAPYAATPYAAPQAPVPAPAPAKSRPKPARPPRPGKGGRPQGGPTAPRPGPGGAQAGGGASTRKAQLTVSRIEPWSVMKFSFMISLVGWVILFVAVAIMYFVLSKLGVFHSIENTVGLVTASKAHAGADAASWFSASRVLGYTMLVGAVNVILITALATVGAVLYNLVTMLAGGIEVTLKETD
jgi:hypothetical protein